MPEYSTPVMDLDKLVARLFDLCNFNPHFFTNHLPASAKAVVSYQNSMASKLLPP